MAKKYFWAGTEYDSMEEVNAAAEAKKVHMDTCPCDYVVVKLLGGTEEAGWVVPAEGLDHAGVMAVTDEDTNFYSVSSITDGDTTVGLTGSEMRAEVSRLVKKYGSWAGLERVIITEEVATEVDMSDYVTPPTAEEV